MTPHSDAPAAPRAGDPPGDSPPALLDAARAAAAAAADVIRAAAPGVRGIRWQEKHPTDFVSEVDLAAEARIREVLTRRLPQAVLYAEESAGDPAALQEPLVVVADPLDGTTNFLHGVPEYAVSIGVLRRGQLVAGVVHHVPRDEVYTATAGGGAWCGATRLEVSPIDRPERALIGTGIPFLRPEEFERYLVQLRRLMSTAAGVRRPGAASCDLVSVAAGRFEGFWETRLAPWDIAAGLLLVREAGGIVTDFAGTQCPVAHTSVVASNGRLHDWLMGQLGD